MLRALRVRTFGLFWAGQLVSGTGTCMQTVAMAWLVLQVSHSALTLATVTTLQLLPMLLFTLPAGALADRVSKRSLLLGAQGLAMAPALVLGILVGVGTPRVWLNRPGFGSASDVWRMGPCRASTHRSSGSGR